MFEGMLLRISAELWQRYSSMRSGTRGARGWTPPLSEGGGASFCLAWAGAQKPFCKCAICILHPKGLGRPKGVCRNLKVFAHLFVLIC